MNQTTSLSHQAKPQASPLQAFKSNFAKFAKAGELDMLPSNVSVDSFRNAAIVAMTDNPEILRCHPESLFKALRKLAAAGLVPDSREAAIVPYKGQAQAMPMVYGLIKTVRNSGQIVTLWAETVRAGEVFSIEIRDGERVFDHKYDPMNRPDEIVGAYAVVKFKDGTIDFEPMGKPDIEKRRKASATQKSDVPTGIWAQWYEEMAKKTVIRALCKRLPMSSEDYNRIHATMVADGLGMRDVTPEGDPEPQEEKGPKPETKTAAVAEKIAKQRRRADPDPVAVEDETAEAEEVGEHDAGEMIDGTATEADDAPAMSDEEWDDICERASVNMQNGADWDSISVMYGDQFEAAGEERVNALKEYLSSDEGSRE